MTPDAKRPGTRAGPPARDTDQQRRPRRRQEQDTQSATAAPHNPEAEEAVLGAALLSRRAAEELTTLLVPDDFYIPANKTVADGLMRLFEAERDIDVVIVADLLKNEGTLDTVGGVARLIHLHNVCPSTSKQAAYAEIIHNHATARRLAGAAAEIRDDALRTFDPHASIMRAGEILERVGAQNGQRAYSTLDIADVGATLDAGLAIPEADFLTRADGHRLIYAGKMHSIVAEPSAGKTWLAALAAIEVLAMGGDVIDVDYEGAPTEILGRLLALGAHPDDLRARFHYINPVGPFGIGEKLELGRMLKATNPDLVIIDGVANALARDNLSEDVAGDVIGWMVKLPKWITSTGAAVLMLDHVKKDNDGRGRWARGSGAKLGEIDGAAYTLNVTAGFSRKRAGSVRATIAKDRPGAVGAIGETAFVMRIEPHADGEHVTIRLDRPEVRKSGDPFKPTLIMQKISEEVEKLGGGPVPATTIKSLIGGHKPRLVEEAIARLAAEGFLVDARAGRARGYKLAKPYRADEHTDEVHDEADGTLFESSGEGHRCGICGTDSDVRLLKTNDGDRYLCLADLTRYHNDEIQLTAIAPPRPTNVTDLEAWKDRNL